MDPSICVELERLGYFFGCSLQSGDLKKTLVNDFIVNDLLRTYGFSCLNFSIRLELERLDFLLILISTIWTPSKEPRRFIFLIRERANQGLFLVRLFC